MSGDEPLRRILRQRQDMNRREHDERAALNRREHDERAALLRDHRAKFAADRPDCSAACVAADGHDWRAMPASGINAAHFIAGKWPMWCPWCGTRCRYGWTEADPEISRATNPTEATP